MTQLIPKSERDSLGIDTLPRAILYALFILDIVTQGNTSLKGKVTYIPSVSSGGTTVSAILVGQVDLTYNHPDTLADGFKLWGNIKPLTTSLSPLFNPSSPSSPTPTNSLPTEPPEIDTVEKYFYWACSILAASVAPDLRYVTRTFSKDNTTITTTVSLPLDYTKMLLNASLLEASLNFVTTYATSDSRSNAIAITNNFFANNSTYFNNGDNSQQSSFISNNSYANNSTHFHN